MFVIAKRPVRPLLPLVLAAIVLFMNGCASTPDKEDSGGVPSGPTVLAAGEKVGRIQITAEPGLDRTSVQYAALCPVPPRRQRITR